MFSFRHHALSISQSAGLDPKAGHKAYASGSLAFASLWICVCSVLFFQSGSLYQVNLNLWVTLQKRLENTALGSSSTLYNNEKGLIFPQVYSGMCSSMTVLNNVGVAQ